MKHGDKQENFSTGAQRDSHEGKSRPDLIGTKFLLELGDLLAADPTSRIDLISPVFLHRLGVLLAQGAEHYGERNWEQGMPLSRILASAMRHLIQTMDGQEDEDHPIQCAFNLMAYVHILHQIRSGSLPIELDDLPHEKNLPTDLTPDKKQPTVIRNCDADEYLNEFCPSCHRNLPTGWRLFANYKCHYCGETF